MIRYLVNGRSIWIDERFPIYERTSRFHAEIKKMALMKTINPYLYSKHADEERKKYNLLHPFVPTLRTHLEEGEPEPLNPVGCLLCATEQEATDYLIAIVHGKCGQAYCLSCICRLIVKHSRCPYCVTEWIKKFMDEVNSVYEAEQVEREMQAARAFNKAGPTNRCTMHTIESLTELMFN